jgi:hypothetical protein
VLPHLFFGGHSEVGVVIYDEALSAPDQLANLVTENILPGFALSGQQVGTLDAIVGIEKHEVAPSGLLGCILEPIITGASALLLAVANVLAPVDRAGEQLGVLQRRYCSISGHDISKRVKEILVTGLKAAVIFIALVQAIDEFPVRLFLLASPRVCPVPDDTRLQVGVAILCRLAAEVASATLSRITRL